MIRLFHKLYFIIHSPHQPEFIKNFEAERALYELLH
jgi:hypothetical protein